MGCTGSKNSQEAPIRSHVHRRLEPPVGFKNTRRRVKRALDEASQAPPKPVMHEDAAAGKRSAQVWRSSLDSVASCTEQPELGAAWLQALLDREFLDREEDRRLLAITDLLKELFQAPMARVSLSAAGRRFLGEWGGPNCSHADGGQKVACCEAGSPAHPASMQVVPDALADARFERCLCVAGPPYVRFYAAAPLISSEGLLLGGLAVMDTRPRSFPAGTLNIICSFAELAVRELEWDVARPQVPRSAEPAPSLDARQKAVRALSTYREAVLLLDLSLPTWPIQYVNERWCASTGLSEAACVGSGLWQVLGAAEDQRAFELAAVSLRARAPFALEILGPADRRLTLELRPATADHLSAGMPPVGIPNLMESWGECAENGGTRGLDSLYFGVLCCEDGEMLPPMLSSPVSFTLPSSASLEETPSPPAHKHGHAAGPHRGANAGAGDDKDSVKSKAQGLLARGMSRASCAASHVSGDTLGGASPLTSRTFTHHARLPYGMGPPDSLRGIKLGPLLGSGSFGRVYRGRWRGASVAVKIMSLLVDTSQEAAPTPALLETMLSKRLFHPNIVQTLDFAVQTKDEDINPVHVRWLTADFGAERGFVEDTCHKRRVQTWVVQEFCGRGTLADAISRGWLRKRDSGSRPPQPNMLSVLATAREVASALACCHEQGVLHGNLTAGNVQLAKACGAAGWDERGFTAKVGDFGLARILDPGQDRLLTKACGTMAYMPLERILDNLLTPAADVYSFGVLCWEMLTGQRAWGGRRPVQIIQARTAQGLKLEISEDIHCPLYLKELVTACLSDDHTQRPAFDEIERGLRALLQGLLGK